VGVPSVKGLSLVSWLTSFDRLFGEQRSAQLRARLPPEIADVLRAGLDEQAWYPIAWFAALCAAGREVTGGGTDMIVAVARDAAASEFSGIHRVVVLFMSPQRLLRTASRVFRRYYSHGSVSTMPIGKTGAEVRWSACAGFDENLWHDCWTAAAVAVSMCGAQDVRAELIHGGSPTDDHSTVVFRWKAP
jgi:hypothetical protein